jgi:high-affinity iron transporter
MGAALLITLREGLEIALVLAMIVAFLVKTERADRLPSVWLGAGAAVAASLVAGLAFKTAIGEFEGRWEQAIEGTLALVAVVVLTWMIFWMRQHARSLEGHLHRRIDEALARSPQALVLVAFVAVAREGFETALFLLGAENGNSSGAQVVLGGLIGLGLAAVLGLAFYRGSHRVDLRRFFQVTGGLLILFAAGLFAKGLHEFRELLEIETSAIAAPVWQITSGPLSEGHTLHDFLEGLFGWSADPERIRFVGYFVYLIPAGWLFFRGGRRPLATPADQPIADQSAADQQSVADQATVPSSARRSAQA